LVLIKRRFSRENPNLFTFYFIFSKEISLKSDSEFTFSYDSIQIDKAKNCEVKKKKLDDFLNQQKLKI